MATPFCGECVKEGRVQDGDQEFQNILSQDHFSKMRNNPPECKSDKNDCVNKLACHCRQVVAEPLITAVGNAPPEMEGPHIMFLGTEIGQQRGQDNSAVGA